MPLVENLLLEFGLSDEVGVCTRRGDESEIAHVCAISSLGFHEENST